MIVKKNNNKNTIAKSSSYDNGGKLNGSIHDATSHMDSKNNKVTNSSSNNNNANANSSKTTSASHINGGSKELDGVAAMR